MYPQKYLLFKCIRYEYYNEFICTYILYIIYAVQIDVRQRERIQQEGNIIIIIIAIVLYQVNRIGAVQHLILFDLGHHLKLFLKIHFGWKLLCIIFIYVNLYYSFACIHRKTLFIG